MIILVLSWEIGHILFGFFQYHKNNVIFFNTWGQNVEASVQPKKDGWSKTIIYE